MEKKSKKGIVIGITSLLLVMLLLVGLTYAYYRTRIIGNNSTDPSISVVSKNLEIRYQDGNATMNMEGLIEPDFEYTKTFSIENTGDDNLSYAIYLIDVINTFERKEDLKYTLTCSSGCNGISNETFPSGISQLTTNTIAAGETQTYTLTFTYLNSEEDQSVDMGKELSAKIQIFAPDEDGTYFPYEEGTLAYNIINNAKNGLNGTIFGEPESTPGVSGSLVKETDEVVNAPMTIANAGFNGWFVHGYGNTPEEAENRMNMVSGSTPQEKCDLVKNKYLEVNYAAYKIEDCTEDGTPMIKTPVYDYEKRLSSTEDDYGISYYYRGRVNDNYVNFAGMCWRIVRIAGDGTIKLILEDQQNECKNNNANWTIPVSNEEGAPTSGYFGYTKTDDNLYIINYLNIDGKATNYENSMATAFKNFQSKIETNLQQKNQKIEDVLKSGNWCLGDKAYSKENTNIETAIPLTREEILNMQRSGTKYYYDAHVRLESNTPQPSLKCNGTILDKWGDNVTNMYVATLTADEVVFAGVGPFLSGAHTINYYLFDNDKNTENDFFTLSPAGLYISESFFKAGPYSIDSNGHPENKSKFRPVISLKSNVKFKSGDGTQTNPYIIN